MDVFKSLFKHDFRCHHCNSVFSFTSKRRKCQTCSNLHLENIFCESCSIVVHPSKFHLFSSKKFCVLCNQKPENSRRTSSMKQLPEYLPTCSEFKRKLRSQVKLLKQDPYKVYTLINKIGKGVTGFVYKAQHSTTGTLVALKQIEIIKQFNKDKIVNEVGLMMLSTHENIVQCFAAYEHQNRIWLCLELMQNTLYSLIAKTDFSEPQIAYIIRETLKALCFLHDNSRVHRDIKSDNILYNASGDIKISDFGFSTQITSEFSLRNSVVGTPSWMAPEIISGDGYDFKVDIWSLGVLLYELTEKELPAKGSSSMEILCHISNTPAPEIEGEWSEDLKEFLSLCLEKDPKRRASAAILSEHRFLEIASKEDFLFCVEEISNSA